MHRLDAEPLESFDAAHDIQERVHRSDFMQVHLLRSDAVDSALSLADQSERANGALLHPVGYRGPLDQSHELADVTAVRLRWDVEFDLLACNTRPADVANRNMDVANPQPSGQFLEPGNRQAQREKSR